MIDTEKIKDRASGAVVGALSASFDVIVSALIRGEPFDGRLSGKLYGTVEKGILKKETRWQENSYTLNH